MGQGSQAPRSTFRQPWAAAKGGTPRIKAFEVDESYTSWIVDLAIISKHSSMAAAAGERGD
ncbi:uncharacterized protein TrAtP1_011123 [Trichoderma atroviride]|uniref:uncharacterized protein n=1 Tax=Hypocrea atroviridis TaxID=63577 RepID=UPI00332EB83C|nr:hypothetical protein TrAtP1_011123 [Trichoderma atroviride]